MATPIGNLDDITLRALKVLKAADLIACEDTRVTGKLLSLLGIGGAALSPYHEHNAERARPALVARLREGAVVALVSDAGTPLVSDPGYRLVRACLEEGLPVTSLPGPSAALTALQLSGLPCDRFLFAGFLPTKDGARRQALAEVAAVPASLLFYESPRRLGDSLAAMAEVLGPRQAAVARELTKLYEEVRRGGLAELAAHYAAEGPPKGEVVVVVGPPPAAAPTGEAELDAALVQALAGASLRDAAAAVAAATGLPKRQVYARAVALVGERGQ
ncbi:16S rRNA (cytidine(1402)-2'-O)-methyltransferase [Telmatospirillum siberiense]|uniref:16S rRNA (cytidine(1402)-2'-O)-methyltransferase n=1 Tax=Telmatospirillum siberiense TaxID=382514 RepID=UPI003084557B